MLTNLPTAWYASTSTEYTGAGLPKPTGFMNTVLDYDYGPDFNYADGTGVMTKVPPTIKRVIAMKAPKVDQDGNELGGVPVVLREAPLGTYLGWNVTAAGFHKGQDRKSVV